MAEASRLCSCRILEGVDSAVFGGGDALVDTFYFSELDETENAGEGGLSDLFVRCFQSPKR